MKTIQHTLAYVLSCKEYNEDDITPECTRTGSSTTDRR